MRIGRRLGFAAWLFAARRLFSCDAPPHRLGVRRPSTSRQPSAASTARASSLLAPSSETSVVSSVSASVPDDERLFQFVFQPLQHVEADGAAADDGKAGGCSDGGVGCRLSTANEVRPGAGGAGGDSCLGPHAPQQGQQRRRIGPQQLGQIDSAPPEPDAEGPQRAQQRARAFRAAPAWRDPGWRNSPPADARCRALRRAGRFAVPVLASAASRSASSGPSRAAMRAAIQASSRACKRVRCFTWASASTSTLGASGEDPATSRADDRAVPPQLAMLAEGDGAVVGAPPARRCAPRSRFPGLSARRRARCGRECPSARGSGTKRKPSSRRWLRRRWRRRRLRPAPVEANSSSRRCFISTEVRRSMKRWVSRSCSASDSRSSTARVIALPMRAVARPALAVRGIGVGADLRQPARQRGDIAFGDIGARDLPRQPVVGNDAVVADQEQEDVAHQPDMLVGGELAEVGQLADIPQPRRPLSRDVASARDLVVVRQRAAAPPHRWRGAPASGRVPAAAHPGFRSARRGCGNPARHCAIAAPAPDRSGGFPPAAPVRLRTARNRR